MQVPDGVFVAGDAMDEPLRFVKLEGPSEEEVAERLAEVAKRVAKILHAHGRMLNDECEEEGEHNWCSQDGPGRRAATRGGASISMRATGGLLAARAPAGTPERPRESRAVGAPTGSAVGALARTPERRHGAVRDEATILRWQAYPALFAEGPVVAAVRAGAAAWIPQGQLPLYFRASRSGATR